LSPLTKLFVGLQVVLSIALAAGVIVFVNTAQNYNQTIETDKAARTAAETAKNNAIAALQAERQTAQAAAAESQNQVNAYKATVAGLQQQLAQQATQLADASSKVTLLTTQNGTLADAVKASQDAQGKLNAAVADLRKAGDQAMQRQSELNASVTDLTNRLDVTERERKYLAEQLAQAQGETQRLSRIITDNKLPLRQDAVASGGGRSGPPISGVVRETRTIAGRPYATISVGSASDVERGMEFNVVDRRTGNFLGILRVDAVEANEASGPLEGPAVAQITAGAEVRTQL
jgi:hypothetical protein